MIPDPVSLVIDEACIAGCKSGHLVSVYLASRPYLLGKGNATKSQDDSLENPGFMEISRSSTAKT